MSRPSSNQHFFAQVPSADIPRSVFDRTHGYKTTFDAGKLIPFLCDEVLPADTFKCKVTAFARMATPIYPIMDNLYLDTFFFFVPNRLLWENWEKFNGAQDDPDDSTDFLIPQVVGDLHPYSSMPDYFGLPTLKQGLSVNALPFRAYNLIYNEWFRDENLQDPRPVPLGDGPDDPNIYVIKRRGKRHDYFTSCLPWPQKGPAVTLPLVGDAPVYVAGTSGVVNSNYQVKFNSLREVGLHSLDGTANLFADLTEVTASTINSLRQAFQVQRLYERDARGGTRYVEILKSHFGVVSPDHRLQRPEYLGGGSAPIYINPVTQTSATGSQPTPQGNIAAYGTCTIHNHGFNKSFVEHGYIIGLMCVRADLSYQQGINRMWSRRTRFDFYWPSLSHLGEQAVLNKEIYFQGAASPQDDQVFGYQEAWAEYRYKPSLITGRFRSNDATGSLHAWHLSQNFTALPTLNSTFIEETPPISRVVAVANQPQFLFDSFIELKCVRPMPVYSVPGMIDHF